MRKTAHKRFSRQRALGSLYDEPLPAKRTGALFTAFPYPTKISPEAIALFIAAHTKPGDTIFDGFAGSGTAGLAALLCEKPTADMRERARRLVLDVQWGPRHAVLYEIGVLGAFVGQTLTNPPDPKAFRRAADEMLRAAEEKDGWLYSAEDPHSRDAAIRYIIWSDELICPACRRKATLWDTCVSFKPAAIASDFACPSCRHKTPLDRIERSTQRVYDDLLGDYRSVRSRRPVRIHGVTGKKTWARAPRLSDHALLQ